MKKYFYLILCTLLFLVTSVNSFASKKLYQGLGQNTVFRASSKDKKDVPIYSFNHVTASAIFDEESKIVNVIVDILEISTPNYHGASMPHFSGWPGTPGYNVADHDTREITGISDNTPEFISNEIKEWKTKRERGSSYGMNPNNDWDKQMNFFQNFFKGKTIAEIEAWAVKNTSDKNGKPLSESSIIEADKEKYAKLTDEEKKALIDVVAGATMSIRDNHGDILGAIKKAYENKVEFTLPN